MKTLIPSKNLGQIESLILWGYIASKLGPSSHLKIQKLLYYIQWYHLAYFWEPIINDDFQAWVHGPVSKIFYDQVKGMSLLYWELKVKKDRDFSKDLKKTLTDDQVSLVDQVLEMLWKYSWIELEGFTHWEKPWIDARDWFDPGEKCAKIISKESIKTFFQSRVA